MNNKGVLLIVSGPSGAGKGTICNEIVRKYPDEYSLSVSATSRAPRGEEKDGVEYFFKSREEFEKLIAEDKLLEYACYVGNYYGTPKQWVTDKLEQGVNIILEIDLQGAFQVSEKIPGTVLVFVMPPSMEELEKRLRRRNTETEAQILSRIERAREELDYADRYDYVITNDDVEKSVDMLHNIAVSEKMKLFKEN
ncbi:MAG: guanylate kinase [Parasporobacterium sp.]|nr:guanylate kinase [Parasporobacterium sp.]